ncbi:MAG: DUF4142 domain-containing protein [Acidobacteriaceae bacterium]|nr:DUF4142 domain-containing protein [Acidobacteriaceae bacterium]
MGIIGAFLVLPPPIALTQNTSRPYLDNGARRLTSTADTVFAMQVSQGGLAEVQLGHLAVSKATSPAVRQFGQRMIDDHSNADDRLKQIAQQENMTLPATMNPKDQALYDKLQMLSGPQFDKTYIKAMVKRHQEDVKEFQKEASKGKDQALKSFASQTLPILQGHLSDAKSAFAQVGSTGY